MSEQSYGNHAHRPVLTIVAAGCWAVAVLGTGLSALGHPVGRTLLVAGVLLTLLCLISMSRAYTTKLQDRIIVLEERLRAERLLSPTQLAAWHTLAPKQVVALRFASDGEYPALAARAAAELLRPDAIKRAITQWRADHRRT